MQIQQIYQNHKSLNLALVIFISTILISTNSTAKVYRPTENQVVASWNTNQSINNTRISLQNVEWHIEQSQYAGSSNLHLRQASMMLDKLLDSQADKPEYWYFKARLFEHQHQFDSALLAINKALLLDDTFTSAWLMKSNVFLITGQNEKAKQSCLRLMGLANIDIVLACTLQTAKGTEQVKMAYEKLQPIVKRFHHDTDNVSASHLWMVQLLADMANQLSLPRQSEVWMSTYHLEDTPISYMSQWADIQLTLGQHKNVLNRLGSIVQQAGYQDDALLMRLAMAEIQLNLQSNQNSVKSERWQLAAKNRVTLRLQRNDIFHAADLSRFYIFIQPEPDKALYWAQQNLAQSQSFEDYALFEAAQAIWHKKQHMIKES